MGLVYRDSHGQGGGKGVAPLVAALCFVAGLRERFGDGFPGIVGRQRFPERVEHAARRLACPQRLSEDGGE